ncbi:MAG: aldehyde dehydrogenase [Gordonia amarae]
MTIDYPDLYIGGSWMSPASADRLPVISPSTEEIIGEVPLGSADDVDRAVAAARSAFDDSSGWAAWTAAQRGEVLTRFADELLARAGDTAQRVSSQNGMPVAFAREIEGGFPQMLVRLNADLAAAQEDELRPSPMGGSNLVTRQPIGVVAAIVPWNFPQAITFMKLAPALAAGCSVVLKPAPQTVLDAFGMAEAAIAAGLPDGVLNIVTGGREVGEYLVGHPGIDKVSFTGSTGAGKAIGRTCGELLRPVSLELGGKSAAVILDDADLVANAQAFFGVTLINNGQVCWLNTRILAPRSRYDEVVDFVAALAGSVVLGDPLAEDTMMGPLVSAAQRDRVEGYIQKGISDGARLVTGGGRPSGFDRGFFVEPTVFTDVDPDSTIAQEEIFGPVLSVIPYTDDAEALAIADNSDYGLGGTVWTADPDRGTAFARKITTGTVGINGYVPDPTVPFGGVKASGLGRSMGVEGLQAFQQLKTIYLDKNA